MLAFSATFLSFEPYASPRMLHSFCYRTVLNLAFAFHVPHVPPFSFPMYVQVGIPDLDVLWFVLVSWRHLF
jgi:hypothetical protein